MEEQSLEMQNRCEEIKLRAERRAGEFMRRQATPMMSNAECAKFLGIAPDTLVKYRCHGKGPTPHKIGRRIVYRERDVESWLAKHRMAGFENDDPQERQVFPLRVRHRPKDFPLTCPP